MKTTMSIKYEVTGEFEIDDLYTQESVRKDIEKKIARAVLDNKGKGKVRVKPLK